MRTREEIMNAVGDTYNGTEMTRGLGFLILEVALDIRDLLTKE